MLRRDAGSIFSVQKLVDRLPDLRHALLAALALDHVVALVAEGLQLRDEAVAADFALAPRHFRAPGAGNLGLAGVLHVHLHDPRIEDLDRFHRLALGVEDHVRRIEVDANARNLRHEGREVLGGLLAGLENERDAVLAALVAHPAHALDVLLERGGVGLVEEARVRRHVLAPEFLRQLRTARDDLLVLLPGLVRNDAAGLLDRLQRRVVLADHADHRGHQLPLALRDLALDERPGLGALGAAMAAVRRDERPERQVDALHARGLHLRGHRLHVGVPAPAADAYPLGSDGRRSERTATRRERERSDQQGLDIPTHK